MDGLIFEVPYIVDMKKTLPVLIIILVSMVLLYRAGYIHMPLTQGGGHTHSLALKQKKTASISEIEDTTFTIQDLRGEWIFFMHYPNQTKTSDISIGSQGDISSTDNDLVQGLRLSLGAQGEIAARNDRVRIHGNVQSGALYFKGIATIGKMKNPVPFSACRISTE
ncbi:MAG: hypothetical protein U9P80_04555 [Thermodesulfobacteriota bacterium]|nr:hypothetical protein [Thermodesulfobacteriota bacterium]